MRLKNKLLFIAFLSIVTPLLVSSSSYAVTICSLNLQRPTLKNKKRLRLLAERISSRKCDIVALQEVTGGSERKARELTERLATLTGTDFNSVVSGSNDRGIRNGFLINPEQVTLLRSTSYESMPLPQINSRQGNRAFSRGPLVVLVELPINKRTNGEKLLLVNFHFKSKHSGYKDSYGLDFEIQRMEMAAGVHHIVRQELRRTPKGTEVVLLGDRNADRQDASALVLKRELELADFGRRGQCSVNKSYKAKCRPGTSEKPRYISLIDLALSKKPPKMRSWGSYRYRGKSFLLDDILVSDDFIRSNSSIIRDAGFWGKFHKGSDHLMVWVELF